MFSLSPKEDKFYDMFISSAHIIYESAEKLKEFMDDLQNRNSRIKEIEEMEHKGDRKQHDILEQLNKSFITPIDREDIYLIAKVMDDIIDAIESTANRFVMFNVDTPTKESMLMADLIVASAKEVIGLMEELKFMNKSKKLGDKIVKINDLEDQGDGIFRQSVTDLFNGSVQPLEVIKWREIYEYLEKTLDSCEDVANLVEGVVMKHA